MKNLFYIVIIIFTSKCFSQNIDSLQLALKNAKQDTTRCKILDLLIEAEENELVWVPYNNELKKIAELNLKLLSTNPLLNKIYSNYLAIALNNSGYLSQEKGEIIKALEYYSASLKLMEATENKKGTASCLNNIAFIYSNQDNISKALEYYKRSLTICEELNEKREAANCINNIGLVYSRQNNYKIALDEYLKSLKLREEIGDKQGIAQTLNNIGNIYLKPALMACPQKNLECIMSGYKKALEYLHKSLAIQQEINDKHGILNSINNIGSIYLVIGDLEGGAGNNPNYKKALELGIKGFHISNELAYAQDVKNSAGNLASVFKRTGNYKKALENYELYILMRDSLNNEATKKAAIKNQMQYEFDKKEIEIKTSAKAIQEKTQLKANENAKRQKLIISGVAFGFIIVLIFSFFIFRSLQQNKKKNAIITEQKLIVDEKQKEILDSIHYAKRIQTALITSEKYVERNLNKLNTN